MNKKSFNVVYNEIKQQLGQTQAVLNEQPLVHLIAIIRPKNPKNTQEVKKKYSNIYSDIGGNSSF